MSKVLVVYNQLWPYRVPIFDLLGQKYDLTVAYSFGGDINTPVSFKTAFLPGRNISRFFIHKDSLYDYCNQFDVVIGYGDISWLSLMALLFRRKRKFKIILWGIGVRASYKNAYGSNTIWDIARFYLMRKADALVFYADRPIDKYKNMGFDANTLFVANNTVAVDPIDEACIRDKLIFIGTLYKQKQIYELLESYKSAFDVLRKVPKLELIGDGDEYDNIKKWLAENNLQDNIFLRGKVYDEAALCGYFSQSIACISPGQAGLSVLKSMGYGVPFITKRNAITGGEIFNIQDQKNGVLYDNDNELEKIITDIANSPQKYIEMGQAAQRHYSEFRKPIDMVNGLVDAIEYVSTH